jgi:hypothetical protein
VPSRLVFRCEFCAAVPDAETQLTLEFQLRELDFGAYVDAPPGGWLTWYGSGPLGPRRYACERHRGELIAYVRTHYGAIAPNPWRRPPFPMTTRTADTERAIRHGGLSGMPKWGRW